MGVGMYSAEPFLLNSLQTLVAGDRVFVGNQPDDFVFGGMVIQVRRVLVLGLGYGGSLRPIAVSAPDATLVAVEHDRRVALTCEALYGGLFPKPTFSVRVADAALVVREGGRYDMICVDLYDGASYPSVVTDPAFWRHVRDRVAPGGVVVVNSWGLPEHLEPFLPPSPQHTLAAVLSAVWGEDLYAIPSRRNTTFLAGCGRSVLEAASTPPWEGLTAVDGAVLRAAPGRLRHAVRVDPPTDMGAGPVPWSQADVDAEMARRWPGMLTRVRRAAQAVGVPGDAVQGRELVYDPDCGRAVTLELVARADVAAAYVPNAVAALSFEADPRVSWFGAWIAEEATELAERFPAWFFRIALPQALAMTCNPFAPRWDWTERLIAAVGEVTGQGPHDGSARRTSGLRSR